MTIAMQDQSLSADDMTAMLSATRGADSNLAGTRTAWARLEVWLTAPHGATETVATLSRTATTPWAVTHIESIAQGPGDTSMQRYSSELTAKVADETDLRLVVFDPWQRVEIGVEAEALLRSALRELALEFGLSDGFTSQIRRTLRERGVIPRTLDEARHVARAEAVAIHRHPCAFSEGLRVAIDRAAEVVAAEVWAADHSLHLRSDDRDEFYHRLLDYLRTDSSLTDIAETILPWEVGGQAGDEGLRELGGPLYTAVLNRVGNVKSFDEEWDEHDDE